MATSLTLNLDPTLIRPLGEAQNEFLELLLTNFHVSRKGEGLALDVEFDMQTPAAWLRKARSHIGDQLNPERRKVCAAELKAVLLGDGQHDYKHDDPAFPFRFGNGGTLPVIRMQNSDYYCLFYREVNPVGWNIANGGADSFSELLDPLATIERELREELIVVEPTRGRRYVFEWVEGRRADHPDFAVARRFWEEVFRKHDFGELGELALPLKWLQAHDSVHIRFNGSSVHTSSKVELNDCLININAEDFGIEIDRVAKISIGPEAVLCDGEVVRGHLLNRVIGLFDVHRFNGALAAGRTKHLPDRIFWSGRDRTTDLANPNQAEKAVENLVGEYLDDIVNRGIWAKDMRPEWQRSESKFGLCPVTNTVVRRYLRLESVEPAPKLPSPMSPNPDVFLSFSSEDRELARRLFTLLQANKRRVFFSDETLHHANFADGIDSALKSARAMVVVGTQPERFYKPWVRYEWQSFHNDILGGRKPWKTPLITVAPNIEPDALPRPLAFRQVLPRDAKSADFMFDELVRFLE